MVSRQNSKRDEEHKSDEEDYSMRFSYQNVINSAITSGIEEIASNHPMLPAEVLAKHLNKSQIIQHFNEIYKKLENERDMSEEEKARYIHKNIADYVSSLKAFNETGKKLILNGARLEDKLKNTDRKIVRREDSDYVERVSQAFEDLYIMMKKGGYDKRMPELEKSAKTLYELGFLDSAINVLNAYGLVDEKSYHEIKNSIKMKIEKESESVKEFYSNYLKEEPKKSDEGEVYFSKSNEKENERAKKSYRALAAVMASSGLLSFSAAGMASITGNVIGLGGKVSSVWLIGMIFFMIALVIVKAKKEYF